MHVLCSFLFASSCAHRQCVKIHVADNVFLFFLMLPPLSGLLDLLQLARLMALQHGRRAKEGESKISATGHRSEHEHRDGYWRRATSGRKQVEREWRELRDRKECHLRECKKCSYMASILPSTHLQNIARHHLHPSHRMSMKTVSETLDSSHARNAASLRAAGSRSRSSQLRHSSLFHVTDGVLRNRHGWCRLCRLCVVDMSVLVGVDGGSGSESRA